MLCVGSCPRYFYSLADAGIFALLPYAGDQYWDGETFQEHAMKMTQFQHVAAL